MIREPQIKRLAANASLQTPYESKIMNARQLFKWLNQNIFNIDIQFEKL